MVIKVIKGNIKYKNGISIGIINLLKCIKRNNINLFAFYEQY